MTALRPQAIGVPWYAREEYARLKRLFADGHRLPPTYDQWLADLQQALQQAEAQGQVAVKARIRLADFPAWCAERGLNVDANARLEFANEAARRHLMGEG